MTENEAIIEVRKLRPRGSIISQKRAEMMDIAINALEEIQQYRAIETELKEKYHANVDIKMLMQHFIETIFKGEKHEGFCILTNEDAKMWDEYQAIGTIEEFKALKEKSVAKKPICKSMPYSEEVGMNDEWLCPTCKAYVGYFTEGMNEPEQMEYCNECGQHIARDWTET